jgi:hypothetical protein
VAAWASLNEIILSSITSIKFQTNELYVKSIKDHTFFAGSFQLQMA